MIRTVISGQFHILKGGIPRGGAGPSPCDLWPVPVVCYTPWSPGEAKARMSSPATHKMNINLKMTHILHEKRRVAAPQPRA